MIDAARGIAQQSLMRFLAALFSLAAIACTTTPDSSSAPAAVVVAFDRESIRPVIVEGIANRESGRAVAANDPVRIASISKLVMALAALRLTDKGIVDLRADVSQYLGWKVRNPSHPDVPVTLAHLLSHRSGLRDANGYVIPLGDSLEAKLADPASWHPDAPGEAPFEYTNLGSPVVATVLEAASGVRYDRLVEREIFAPLGIEACLNWIGCPSVQAERAVVLYRNTDDVERDDAADRPPHCTMPVAEGVRCDLDDYVPGTNASIFSPQGGVRIGMMDLAKIGQHLLSLPRNSLLMNPFWIELLLGRQARIQGQEFFCTYGFAIQQIEIPEQSCDDRLFGDGVTRLGHAGDAYGLHSGLWVDPKSGKGIAYFITGVPERPEDAEEGGFAEEERSLIARAQAKLAADGD